MNTRFWVQTLLSVARSGAARLAQALAETDQDDGSVFRTMPPDTRRTSDAEQRIAAARKARLRL